MNSVWAYVLPLAAALSYVTAALFIKRAAELGAGVWRTAVVANVLSALCFQPLRLLGGHHSPFAHWWQPAVVALLFLAGQVLTFVSLSRGDVSVATPVLGLKILLVAVFSTIFLSQPLTVQLWMSAALATAGIGLLNRSGGAKTSAAQNDDVRHAIVRHTVLTAGLSAVSFALFDVLVQTWAPLWGIGRFLPATMGLVGVFSLALIPLFEAPLHHLPSLARRPLLFGAMFLSFQAVMFVSAIAQFGNATASNVIYSSRGMWSIAAVWLLGHWFHNQEKQQGAAVLRWRLAGAGLMFAAILLVLL